MSLTYRRHKRRPPCRTLWHRTTGKHWSWCWTSARRPVVLA